MLVTKNSSKWNVVQHAMYAPNIGEVTAVQSPCGASAGAAAVGSQRRCRPKKMPVAERRPSDQKEPRTKAIAATLWGVEAKEVRG